MKTVYYEWTERNDPEEKEYIKEIHTETSEELYILDRTEEKSSWEKIPGREEEYFYSEGRWKVIPGKQIPGRMGAN